METKGDEGRNADIEASPLIPMLSPNLLVL